MIGSRTRGVFTKQCEICHETFSGPFNRVNGKRFCSHRCANIGQRVSRDGSSHVEGDDSIRLILLTKGAVAIVDAGDFYWLSQWSWYLQNEGYAARTSKAGGAKRQIYLHRLILDAPDELWVDHADRNRLNNRRSNLRVCTAGQSNHNKRHWGKQSKYRGVFWHEHAGQWAAAIGVHGKPIRLGRFVAEEDAALAYDAEARKHYGVFAQTNFPGKES